MIPRLQTIVLALTLALCLVKAAASPVEGTWEGSKNGVRAATLTVAEKDGFLTGTVIFYIVRDNGDGTSNGAPLPAQPLRGVGWDGHTLRFSIARHDGVSIPFEMRLSGRGKAELRRSGTSEPDEIVPMLLRK